VPHLASLFRTYFSGPARRYKSLASQRISQEVNLRFRPSTWEFRITQDFQYQVRKLNHTPANADCFLANGGNDLLGRLND
jgi:hypothetical protein